MNYLVHCLVVVVLVLWSGVGFSSAQDQYWDPALLAHFSFDVEPDPINGFVDPVSKWQQGSSSSWNISHSQYMFGGGSLYASSSVGGVSLKISSPLTATGSTTVPWFGSSSSDGLADFTLAFWVLAKGFNPPSSAPATLFSSLNGGFKVEMFNVNKIKIGLTGNTPGVEIPCDFSTWTFVTVTKSSATSGSNLFVSFNGTLASSSTFSYPSYSSSLTSFGANSDSPNYAYALYGNVLLDEFWIFSRALNSSEAGLLMQTNWIRPPTSDLLFGYGSPGAPQVAIDGPIYNDTCQIQINELRVFFDSWNAPNQVKYHRLGTTYDELKVDVNFWQSRVTGNQQFSLSAIPLCFPYPYLTTTDQVDFFSTIKNDFPGKYWFSPGILELFGPSIAPGENARARFYYTLLSHRDRIQQVEHFLRVDLVNFFSALMRNRQASLLLVSSFFEAAQLQAIEIQIQLLADAIKDMTKKNPVDIVFDVLSIGFDIVGIGAVFASEGAKQFFDVVKGVFDIAKDSYALAQNFESGGFNPDFHSDSTNVHFTGFGKTSLQDRKNSTGYLFQEPQISNSPQPAQTTVADVEAQLISMNEHIVTSIDSIMSQVINNYGYMRALSELSFSIEPLSDINSILGEALHYQDLLWQRTLLIKFFKSQFKFNFYEGKCNIEPLNPTSTPRFHDQVWDPLRDYINGLTDGEQSWFRMLSIPVYGTDYDYSVWFRNGDNHDGQYFLGATTVTLYDSMCNFTSFGNWVNNNAVIHPQALLPSNNDPQFLSVFGISG